MNGPRPYRLFSPEVIVKQIDTLVNKYGVKNIKFVDEMFVLNPEHVFGITNRLIDQKLNEKINIWAYARVDSAKPKFLDSLKKAGFSWLGLGIESGNRDVRNVANKMELGHDDIVNVCARIQESGINVNGAFIFGLPEDTMERMQETYDLAVELKLDFANFYSAMAYPGSPLRYGVVDKTLLPATWEGYAQHGYDTFPLRNVHLSNDKILAFRDQKHMEYFSRPEFHKQILEKFGQRALDEVKIMLMLGKPKRKILGD